MQIRAMSGNGVLGKQTGGLGERKTAWKGARAAGRGTEGKQFLEELTAATICKSSGKAPRKFPGATYAHAPGHAAARVSFVSGG